MPRSAAFGVAAIAALAQASPLFAEVTAQSEHGFVSENSVVIDAPAAQVWAHLVEPENWWNGDHSWSGEARNFSLDPRAGGCFCEALPDGGSVEHLRVVYASPGKMLRLSGGLGPLQSEAVNGALTIELAAHGEATRVAWTLVAGGYGRFALDAIAPAVDRVQHEQLTRLARLVETGRPDEAR